MKKLFTVFAALLTAGLFAAEASTLTPRQFWNANWARGDVYAAIVEAVKAGTVKLTGNVDTDGIYYLALHLAGGSTLAECLAEFEGAHPANLYWGWLPYIFKHAVTEEDRQLIEAMYNAGIASQDPETSRNAKRGYARACFVRGDLDAAPAEYHAGSVCYFTPQVFRHRIANKTMTCREAFDILVQAFDTNDANPGDALASLNMLVKYALDGNIPDAEMAAVLKRIDRRYCSRAVGTSKRAQEWGVFIGQITELRKKY